MGSPIGGKRSIKIFILYLMENINYPLRFETIGDIIMQTDYVMYLDFAECFWELVDTGLIEETQEDGIAYYAVTDKGSFVARELRGAVTSVILHESMEKALSYLDFKRRGVVPRTDIEEASKGRFYIICTLTEKGECIFRQRLKVDTYERAKMIEANFHDRAEAIYRGIHAMMAGKVNYLFD